MTCDPRIRCRTITTHDEKDQDEVEHPKARARIDKLVPLRKTSGGHSTLHPEGDKSSTERSLPTTEGTLIFIASSSHAETVH